METSLTTIDNINFQSQAIATYVVIGLYGLLAIYILYSLLKLCSTAFTYMKDGSHETIEFNVICLASILFIIVARASQVWFFKAFVEKDDPQPEPQSYANAKNLVSLMTHVSIVFVNDIYLYGSIVWFRMIFDAENEEEFIKAKRWIRYGLVYFFNPMLLIVLIALHVYKPGSLQLQNGLLLGASAFIEAVFVYSCFKLLKHWDSLEVADNMKYKLLMRVLVVLSFLRLAVFAFQVFDESVDDLRSGSQWLWTMAIPVYSILLSMLPIVIFLYLFKCKFNIRDLGYGVSQILVRSEM